jgi:hypothetical protein
MRWVPVALVSVAMVVLIIVAMVIGMDREDRRMEIQVHHYPTLTTQPVAK